MKITLLGTGTSQGVPVIGCHCPVCQSNNSKDKRLRTSALLEWDTHRLIIDCGPDFRSQMLREQVDHIDAILFTHEHADHTAGLDDIRPLYFQQKQPIPIYGLKRVLENLQKRFDYIFTRENRYPGAPEVAPHSIIPFKTFTIKDLPITPIEIMHGSLPIAGYIFNQKIAYITDAKKLPAPSKEKLKGIELLIVNALHHRPHKMHMNLKESLKLIEELQPHQAVLTHISHHMGLYDDINLQLPENVQMGFDGMQVEI